jgi:hypothetical protein
MSRFIAFFSGNTLIIRRDKASDSLLKMMDMKGHLILQTRIKKEAVDINCSGLTRGIYLLHISGREGDSVIKIIR